jgi:tetratricopeptide (TPR) repeat protein
MRIDFYLRKISLFTFTLVCCFGVLACKQFRGAEYYYSKGITQKKISNIELAIKFFTQSIEVDSNYIDAIYSRGNCYMEKSMYSKALRDYNRFLSIDTSFIEPYYQKSICLMSMDSFQAAINNLNIAFRLKGGYNSLAIVHLKNDFVEFEEEDVSLFEILLNRGTCKMKIKNYKGAIQDYTYCIGFGYEKLRIERAFCFYKLSLYDKACDDIKKVSYLNDPEVITKIEEYCR